YSQMPRCQVRGSIQTNPCAVSSGECNRDVVVWMGYSVKTFNGYRYTEWRPYIEEEGGCELNRWENMSNEMKSDFTKRRSVSKWRADWDVPPVEQELFNDYDETKKFGDWENTNLAITTN